MVQHGLNYTTECSILAQPRHRQPKHKPEEHNTSWYSRKWETGKRSSLLDALGAHSKEIIPYGPQDWRLTTP